MSTNRTTKIFLLSLIVLLVVLAALIAVWVVVTQKGSTLKDNMQAVRDREELNQEQIKLEANLAETAAERTRLEEHILKGEDGAVRLLSTVDEVARDLNIALETKRLEVLVDEEALFDKLEVVFAVEGPERSVMKMIQLLELVPYRSELVGLETSRQRSLETGALSTESTLTLHASIVKE